MWFDTDGNERIKAFELPAHAVSPDVDAAIFEPSNIDLSIDRRPDRDCQTYRYLYDTRSAHTSRQG